MGGAIACSAPPERSDVEQVGRVEQAYTPQYFMADGNYTFEDGSQIDYASVALHGFYDTLGQTDVGRLLISIPGRLPYWTEGTDAGRFGIDQPNLLFNVTHSGIYLGTPTRAGWAMWEQYTTALSNTMRLGDDGRGLSVFVSTACSNLYFRDGRQWERWANIMLGGLKLSFGAYCPIYAGQEMEYVGPMLAEYLQAGYVLSAAWWYTMTYLSAQTVAGLATGLNTDDCFSRLYTMTWQNHQDFDHLRDGDVQDHCFWYVDSPWYCDLGP